MRPLSSTRTGSPRAGVPRRLLLGLPVLGAAGALAACSGGERPVVRTTATPTPSSTGLSVTLEGAELELTVGPVVRVRSADQDMTVLPIGVTHTGAGPEVNVGEVVLGSTASMLGDYRPLRLIDTAGSRAWSTTTSQSVFDPLKPGGEVTLYATFGPVDVEQVVVFVARCGLIEVPVLDDGDPQAPQVDVKAVVSQADPLDDLREPVGLERYAEALDGSSAGLTTEEETTVDVASDVTFAVDSAELSGEADTVLTGVADTISGYEGGELTITGHTDDVADEAHNQTLSEQRAQAVADRLGALTDLTAWTVSVSGKGETEPRAGNDTEEGRQANRRVEVVIAPTGGTEDGLSRSSTSAEPPPAEGPQGPGGQGVTVSGGLGTIHVSLEGVTRRDGLLLAQLTVTGGAGGSITPLGAGWFDDPGSVLANARDELAGVTSLLSADGLTLLSSADRVYPVDYLLPGAMAHRPLTELDLLSTLDEGETTSICVVWPDTGEDSVVVDHPGDGLLTYPWRLTDVPVTEG
ncbi:OmpA family protein [Actinomyces howellii]|uniref:Outer membrane porin F n=1 Tax=Actinomyces howellii TaxID=52771 RepID=A0A3S4RAK6_9ACTO|nr:OmpA family protein [Actinomyces howellii]VEG27737.1 Outer membrane porin F precursor [Actinomyces howellii]